MDKVFVVQMRQANKCGSLKNDAIINLHLGSDAYVSIFHFKTLVFNTNVDQFLKGASNIVQNCKNSHFNDCYHGHTVTGDLRMLKENRLRELFTKV